VINGNNGRTEIVSYFPGGVNGLELRKELCSIIMSVFNQLPYTGESLDSLFGEGSNYVSLYGEVAKCRDLCSTAALTRKRQPIEMIVINNGSTDETGAFLRDWDPKVPFLMNYKVITNPVNIGISRAWNQGLREAAGDYLAVISNDVIACEGWWEDLIDYLGENPGAGAACPYTHIGGDKGTFPERARKHVEEKKGSVEQGFLANCWVMTREAFEKVGLFDEEFKTVAWEDFDYYWRMLESGFKPACLHKMVLYHYGSVTRKHFPAGYEEINRKRFIEKYGRTV